MPATLLRPFLKHVAIYEDRATGFAQQPEGHPRVDREQGIIYGAKVVGRESPNTHGRPEVTKGTRYTDEAMEKEVRLLNGVKLNLNHPANRTSRIDRDAEDRLGKLMNPRIIEGQIYADMHVLKTHPMYERLCEAAERMPDAFALSHNALGDGPVEDGVWVITHIERVKSVDLVADGGTNSSLFESQVIPVKKKLRELCESSPDLRSKLDKFLSLCASSGERGRQILEMESEGGDYRDHLHAARKMCEDMGDHEMAGKIHKLMAPEKPEAAPEEETTTDAKGGDGEERTEKKAEKKAEKEETEKPKMESRLRELELKDSCRTLCESLRFIPSAVQLKALMPLNESERKDLIKEFQAGQSRSGVQSRSLIADPDKTKPLQESKVPADDDELLAWLRG